MARISLSDLESRHPSDLAGVHPELRFDFGRVRMGLMAKYPTPLMTATRLVGVNRLRYADRPAHEEASRLDGIEIPARYGINDPVVLLDVEEMSGDASRYAERQIHNLRTGRISITSDPVLHPAKHELIHPVVAQGLRCPQLRRELDVKLEVFFTRKSPNSFDPTAAGPVQALLRRSSTSANAGRNIIEFLTEALVEWNSLGPQAGLAARTVGPTFDRYVS